MTLSFNLSGDPLCLDNIKTCCAASRLAYSQSTITDADSGESALIQNCGNCTLIAFPGTHDLRDVLRDLDCLRVTTLILGETCVVHAGFNRAFNSVIGGIISHLQNPFPRILGQGSALFLTGHSKGAAVARRCALALLEKNFPVAGLITFGEPRGGDARYAAVCNRFLGGRTLRITNAADPVPWIPAWLAGNRHCGPEGWLPPERRASLCEGSNAPRSKIAYSPSLWLQLLLNSAEIFRAWRLKDRAPLADHHIDNYLLRINAP